MYFLKKILPISLYILFNSVNSAYAYIDPGTGSVILQAILGAIAAGFSYCAFYWKKVKNFFRKLFGKKEKNN